MKKMIIAAMAAVFSAGVFAMSLAEASAKITSIIDNPAGMTTVMKELSAEDQVAFLKRVNGAIASTKRTVDSKTELFLAVNKAALLSRKGNIKELIAEVFATVPPAALVVINEKFAEELFNRKSNAANPISDDKLKANALSAMKSVGARTSGRDKDVRDTFAILMFLRSSKGTPSDLKDSLVAMLPDGQVREDAKTLWIPSAMGEGVPKTYDPMLIAAGVQDDEMPATVNNFLNRQGPMLLAVSLMSELSSTVDKNGSSTIVHGEYFLDPNKWALPEEGVGGLNRVPRSLNPDDRWYPGYHRGGSVGEGGFGGSGEAGGYRMQTTY